MAELVNFYFEELPKVKIVGKTISVDWQKIGEFNPIPEFWEKCFSDGTFKKLDELKNQTHDTSYVGYMTMNSYTCGMIVKPECPVPTGFTFDQLEPAKIAVGWIKGEDKDVFMNAHTLTDEAMKKEGYSFDMTAGWSMEVYNDPRFTKKDENDNVVMDYYIPAVKG